MCSETPPRGNTDFAFRTAMSRRRQIASKPCSTAIRRPFANSNRRCESRVGKDLTNSTGNKCAALGLLGLLCFCR